jgi:hypothetical protein
VPQIESGWDSEVHHLLQSSCVSVRFLVSVCPAVAHIVTEALLLATMSVSS